MNSIAYIAVIFAVSLCSATLTLAAESELPQSSVKQGGGATQKYPKVVLYSTSWCPHCKAAKEYMTQKNIPFINRDVELDDKAMEDLSDKYKSKGVPVIVIGNDEKVLRGFSEERFEAAIGEVQKKK